MRNYFKLALIIQLVVIVILGYYTVNLLQKYKGAEKLTAAQTQNLAKEGSLVGGLVAIKNQLTFIWKDKKEAYNAQKRIATENGTAASPPQQIDTQRSSDLLFSVELADLPQTDNPVPAYLLEEYERVKSRFSPDSQLALVKYGSDEFKTSTFRQKLNQVLTVKLYVIAQFRQPIDFPTISRLKRLGFSPIHQFPLSEYIDKKLGVFYVRYHKLLPAITRFQNIESVYILKDYTARGFYQLGMKSLAQNKDLNIEINFPFSKTGRDLLYKKNTVAGAPQLLEHSVDEFKSEVSVPIDKGQIVTFHSDLRYRIDVEKLLTTHIYVQGNRYKRANYQADMNTHYHDIYNEFTQFSEKIVPSAYVNSLIRRLDTNASIAEIWKQLTRILDKEILYDWQKRDLFFSGNLTYYNIKNMYMTAQELSKKRKGACTERTALEIALLRKLGIAARAATRLYHIYTEIYIPDAGWTTTSLTINEIPLDVSANEDMSYFVSWSPEHPIRLKWEGYLYPNIVY